MAHTNCYNDLFLHDSGQKNGPLFCVVGSINMDLVAQVERFPKPKETIFGNSFGTYPGGKGANQAVALARLGAAVVMTGKVGDDMFGKDYRETLRHEKVNIDLVETAPNSSTGVAVIEVDARGENHIVVISGANGLVDCDYIKRHIKQLSQAQVVLFQLELPLPTIAYAMEQLCGCGKTIILDPAPVPEDPSALNEVKALLRYVDILTPNETEVRSLTGVTVNDCASAAAAGAILLQQGVKAVVIKAGKKGAYVIENSPVCADEKKDQTNPEKAVVRHSEGFSVEVKDTTAAGDSFNAGLAYALGTGKTLNEAVGFANTVGAAACMKIGAQSAMPYQKDLSQ